MNRFRDEDREWRQPEKDDRHDYDSEEKERSSRNYCGPTRKVRFNSEHDAWKRYNEIYEADPNVPTMRVYKCQYCGGFHLTSKV